MNGADSARPTATGANRIPGSGRRIFSPLSSRTASQPKATTSTADRIAHVSRQLRATRGAAKTGTNNAIARTPNWPRPNPTPASRATPRARPPTEPAEPPLATGEGTPAIRSQPCRPNNDEAHGRLASTANTEAAAATPIIAKEARHDPPASNVPNARTTAMATTSNANDGTNAAVTAASNAN